MEHWAKFLGDLQDADLRAWLAIEQDEARASLGAQLALVKRGRGLAPYQARGVLASVKWAAVILPEAARLTGSAASRAALLAWASELRDLVSPLVPYALRSAEPDPDTWLALTQFPSARSGRPLRRRGHLTLVHTRE